MEILKDLSSKNHDSKIFKVENYIYKQFDVLIKLNNHLSFLSSINK